MARTPSLTVAAGRRPAPNGRPRELPSAPAFRALTCDIGPLLRAVRGLARGPGHDRVRAGFVAVRDERCPWSSQAAEHGVVGHQVGVAVRIGTTIIAPGRP